MEISELQRLVPDIRGVEISHVIIVHMKSKIVCLKDFEKVVPAVRSVFPKEQHKNILLTPFDGDVLHAVPNYTTSSIVNVCFEIIDIIEAPGHAESVIGDLQEQYYKRLLSSPKRAKRWLIAQTALILYGWILDLMRQFVRARAGK